MHYAYSIAALLFHSQNHLLVDADDGTQGRRFTAQTKQAANGCIARWRHRLPDGDIAASPCQVVPCWKLHKPAVDRHGDHLRNQVVLCSNCWLVLCNNC